MSTLACSWHEESLQVKTRSARKRPGVSSVPPIEADAPNVVWAIDFQFDSTTDGMAIKIASMIDEHTRESLMNIVERSIAAERRVTELETAYTLAGGVSHALQQFCENKTGLVYIQPDRPWVNGHIESFNNPLRKAVPFPQEAQATKANRQRASPTTTQRACLYATRR